VSRNVPKPWGGEEVFAETERYVGKILTVRAGQRLSLQYHVRKDETMRVMAGRCELHIGRFPGDRELQVLQLGPGDVCHIEPGVVHRLVAVTDVSVIEVSTPDLDDVVRIEDVYGRTGTSLP